MHTFGQQVAGKWQPRLRRHCPSVASRPHVEVADLAIQSGEAPQLEAPAADESQRPAFDWGRQWYPVAFAEDMEPGRPHQVTVLGREMVLWRDAQGDWRAFEDRCPHRLAPLSEGRIEEDGSLACSYHGWRFDQGGKCIAIPQALDAKAKQAACNSSRSAVASYPVQVAEHMIWVWPTAGPAEFISSAASPALVTAELAGLPADTHIYNVGKSFMREVPYDWKILVENLVDPAHVPFTHHGIQGNRYSETAGYLRMEPTPGFAAEGVSFETRMKMFNPKAETLTQIQFHAPVRVRYFTPRAGGFSVMNLFVVPVAPGRSRVYFTLFTNIESKFAKMGARIPRWLDHALQRNSVFDGDAIFLHVLERTLARESAQEGGSWQASYYMPTQSDRIVIGFRKWLDANGGQPQWPPGVSAALPPREYKREVLLDRYETHTKHCSACRKALSVFRALRTAAVVAAGALLLALAAVLGRGAAPLSLLPVALLAGAAACGLGWKVASDWVQKYLYIDYVHQDHK